MTDVTNKTRLLVLKYKDSNAYIRLSADQVPEVQKLFDGHGIRYWVSESNLSVNGAPYQTVIYLYHAMDPAFVQSLLDDVG